MVITQIIIDIQENTEISCYILKREDAKQIEYDIAKVFENFTNNFVKELEKKLDIKAEKTVIENRDKNTNTNEVKQLFIRPLYERLKNFEKQFENSRFDTKQKVNQRIRELKKIIEIINSVKI